MISFCRIQIVPRDAPNIVLAALQNRSALSHVVSNAILWVAMVLKAVREDRNRFDTVIVAAEDKVRLRLNHDALSDTKGRLQLQLPKSINTRQGKAKPKVPSDNSLTENMFDELKNQWGWTGYTTRDTKRSQLMARLVALVYNWWGIFTRMGTGGTHREAITTRPALMEGVAKRTEHGREVSLTMTSLHGKAKKIANLLSGISQYLHKFLAGATQLDGRERWTTLLRKIFWYFYQGSPQPGGAATPLAVG